MPRNFTWPSEENIARPASFWIGAFAIVRQLHSCVPEALLTASGDDSATGFMPVSFYLFDVSKQRLHPPYVHAHPPVRICESRSVSWHLFNFLFLQELTAWSTKTVARLFMPCLLDHGLSFLVKYHLPINICYKWVKGRKQILILLHKYLCIIVSMQ